MDLGRLADLAGPGGFEYHSKWYSLHNQEWRVLKLLAKRAEPVGYHDIAAAAFTKSHETVLDRLKRKRVHQTSYSRWGRMMAHSRAAEPGD